MPHYDVGEKVELFSKSKGEWSVGAVVSERNSSRGTVLTVRTKHKGAFREKEVLAANEDVVRKLDPRNGSYIVECLCRKPMVFAPNGTVKIEGKREQRCDLRGCPLKEKEPCFQCPRGGVDLHTAGYVLCVDCAFIELFERPFEPRTDVEVCDGRIGVQAGSKPFSEGGINFAFYGKYQTKEKYGMQCVVKKHKKKHWYSEDGYAGDMRCHELAQKLVAKWNELGVVKKRYMMIVPVIGTKGGFFASLFRQSLNKNVPEEEKKDQVLAGEVVIVEDYVRGDFVKWNSNSGWIGDQSVSVQAFCHWTFHQSNGEYLFCDAQGVRRPNSYILTDPCINSQEGGKFGQTDVGQQFILQWFKTHRCNRYCDRLWKKPAPDSLQGAPRMRSVRSTTVSINTGLKDSEWASRNPQYSDLKVTSQSRLTITHS